MTNVVPGNRVLAALLAAFLASTTAPQLAAQTGWLPVESGTVQPLNRIDWTAASPGAPYPGLLHVVGDSGTILVSETAGIDWSIPTGIPTTVDLNGVAFPYPDTGYIVGDSATIIRAVRGSGTYQFTPIPSVPATQNLNSVAVVPLTVTGLTAGDAGTMLRTTTRGTTWNAHTTNTPLNINSVRMANVSRSFACGDSGLILRSTSSGNWITLPTDAAYAGTDLHSIDTWGSNGDTAWVVGKQGTILHSRNAGRATPNWMPEESGVSVTLRSVRRFHGIVWAVGDSGVILKSDNGGYDWTRVESGTTENLRDIAFPDPAHGIVVGDHGTILRTASAGEYRPVTAYPVRVRFGDVVRGESRTGIFTIRNLSPASVDVSLGNPASPAFSVSPAGATVPAFADAHFIVTYSPAARGNDSGTIAITVDGSAYSIAVPVSGRGVDPVHPGGWTWLNPLPHGNPLLDIACFDADRGVAVGWAGATARTTDGGQTWLTDPMASGTTDDLRAVAVTGPADAVAVGGYGSIVRTVDHGAGWSKSPGPVPIDSLVGVSFYGPDTGYATAFDNGGYAERWWTGAIYKTTDGGTSWAPVYLNGGPQTDDVVIIQPLGIATPGPGLAVAVGGWVSTASSNVNGSILRTTDGGFTWSRVVGNWPRLNAVAFADDTLGFAVGGFGTVMKTTDGGQTWTKVAVPVTQNLVDVTFPDPGHLIATGEQGAVLTSTDGGTGWTLSTHPWGSYQRSAAFIPPATLLSVGGGNGIFRSTDLGSTWEMISSSFLYDPLVGVSFRDPVNGIAITPYGKILRSSDGGATWRVLTEGTLISHVRHELTSVSYRPPDVVTVVGKFGTILRSTDGGVTWDERPSGTSQILTRVNFDGPTTGYVAGLGGTILKTTDAGEHWVSQATSFTGIIGGIDLDGTGGVIAAGTGKILRSSDGGLHWDLIPAADGRQLFDAALEGPAGVVVGAWGAVVATSDGGESWEERESGTTDHLYRVQLSASGAGTAVGDGGAIIRTTDGGQTWMPAPAGWRLPLYDVSFVDDLVGVVVGDYGTILRTESGGFGATQPTDAAVPPVPGWYRLDQNYPNPFNPVTTIRFRLPVESRVVLRIYDMLGRAVTTLVDGVRQAGEQAVTWDARGVASGVYVYRLEATGVRSPGENFTRDIRMVLVR